VSLAEIIDLAGRTEIAESGGGHGQKGVDFQRAWAAMQILELEAQNRRDFLFLFECFQDVAEFDSSIEPTSVRLFQVKKKDRGEWSWTDLTGLSKRASSRKKFASSPVGKLCASLAAFKSIQTGGAFVSNAGCSVDLASGGTAATTSGCHLLLLPEALRQDLGDAIATLPNITSAPDLSTIDLVRVPLPPDAPETFLTGVAHNFLASRSPRHAGQASSFVMALIARLSALGRRTDRCSDFNQLKRERGYSRSDFLSDLEKLASIPDTVALMDDWINQLRDEGLPVSERTAIRLEALGISRRQLVSPTAPSALDQECSNWVQKERPSKLLLPWLERACAEIGRTTSGVTHTQIYARVIPSAIRTCADQT
jgi:hypothetical protein